MSLKYDIEKFDGRINFGLWQVQVRDLLIQSGLQKALKGKPIQSSDKEAESSMSDEDWEELDLKAASMIRLSLAKNVLANIHGVSVAKKLWEKLEELYQTKSISNRLYLKEQFHLLRMETGTKISNHLSALNGIVSELEAIGVKIDDEDKALHLIWSLPSTYEHIKPILIYGKETVSFAKVTSKLISEERRLAGQNIHSDNAAFVTENGKRRNFMRKKATCWNCGQIGYVKRNCPKNRAGSVNCLGSDNASRLAEEDEVVVL